MTKDLEFPHASPLVHQFVTYIARFDTVGPVSPSSTDEILTLGRGTILLVSHPG